MGNLHGKQNPGNFSEEAQPNSEGKTEHIRKGQGSGAQKTPGEIWEDAPSNDIIESSLQTNLPQGG